MGTLVNTYRSRRRRHFEDRLGGQSSDDGTSLHGGFVQREAVFRIVKGEESDAKQGVRHNLSSFTMAGYVRELSRRL